MGLSRWLSGLCRAQWLGSNKKCSKLQTSWGPASEVLKVTSALLYWPKILKHRLCLLKGVEMYHFQKTHGKGHSVVVGHLLKYSPPTSGRASLTFSLEFCNRIWVFLCPLSVNLWILEWKCQVPFKNILTGILSEVSASMGSTNVFWMPTNMC